MVNVDTMERNDTTIYTNKLKKQQSQLSQVQTCTALLKMTGNIKDTFSLRKVLEQFTCEVDHL
jgi:hypothetical protein